MKLTHDQLRTFDQELRERDPRFLRIVSTHAADGQGLYELRTASGARSDAAFTFEGDRIVTPLFDQATRARLRAASTAAPDPYAAGLATLKAAAETPESSFAERYAADRLREAMAMRAALDADVETHPLPRLTAAELAEFKPPNPYVAGIKALQLKETR